MKIVDIRSGQGEAPSILDEVKHNPLVFRTPSKEHVQYMVKCCSGAGDRDWSLSQLTQNNKALAEIFQNRLALELASQFADLGSKDFWVPQASFMSARIAKPREFTNRRSLPWGVTLHSTPNPSDGVGMNFLTAAAGCGVLVATSRFTDQYFMAAHAGKGSLVDMHMFRYGCKDPNREHGSVVWAIAADAKRAGVDPRDLILRLFFALPASSFPHPYNHQDYGKINQALIPYLLATCGSHAVPVYNGVPCVDISKIIKSQARQQGMHFEEPAECRLPSHFASDGRIRKPRNLATVVKR